MNSILVAGDPNSRDFVDASYGDLAEVTFASSIDEAERVLKKQAPTILIGTLVFDDSQFLRMLPLALELGVKVVVIDCPYTNVTEAILGTLREYAADMGVAAWWDMRATVSASGIDAASKEIRAIVQKLLNGETQASNLALTA